MAIRILIINSNNQLVKIIRDKFSDWDIDLILASEISLAFYLCRKNLPD